MSEILQVEDVSFSYGSKPLLQNISFSLSKGDIMCVLGMNGVGKTTLLNCINRNLKINGGNILVNSIPIKSIARKNLAKLISRVPATIESRINSEVFDFIMLGRYPYQEGNWWESSEDYEIVGDIIHRLEIDHLVNRNLLSISSGELQRVLLAKALAQTPSLLLVDEPSSNLDLKYKLKIISLLRREAKNGVAIIVASHDLNLVSSFCNKIIMLKYGKIFKNGFTHQILNKNNIEELYEIEVNFTKIKSQIAIVPQLQEARF